MADLIGHQMSNYRLIRVLGQGGFADVYLGEHIHLGTQAAIKILHDRLMAKELPSFQQEAQVIARLKHPHIVHVFDFGFDASGLPFLVMDYLPGGNLRTVHPQGQRVPQELVVSYTSQLAQALQYAHDARIIHRDVKPENVLLGPNRELLLSDFGIAVVAHSSASMTPQNAYGTVHYMAPEQINGQPREASDQYSLAVVVYELLCGELPFDGNSAIEIAMHHISTRPPPQRAKRPKKYPHVERVIFKALSKDPNERFQSVQAFADALEQGSLQVSSTSEPPFLSSKQAPSALPQTGPALAASPIPHLSGTSRLLNTPLPSQSLSAFVFPRAAKVQASPDTTELPGGIHASCLLSWMLFDIIAAIVYSSERLNAVGPLLIASSILFFFWGWVVTQTTGRFRAGVRSSVRGTIAVALGVWLYLAICYGNALFGNYLLALGYGAFLFMLPAWMLLTLIGLASSGLGSLIGRQLWRRSP